MSCRLNSEFPAIWQRLWCWCVRMQGLYRTVDMGMLLSLTANAIGVVDNLPHWQAREIELMSDPPQAIECDREIIEETPVSVSVVPQSLKVIVPKTAAPPL